MSSYNQHRGVVFANAGFHVCFVADNVLHFDFKRAYWKQAAERTKARINVVIRRVWMNLVVDKLSHENVGEFKRASLEVEEKKLPSSIKSLESKI